VGEQQALASVKPEQVGVPVPGIWCGSWLRGVACAEDSEQLPRAPQDHQPIIGVRRAANARQDAAAAGPASVSEGQTAGSVLPYRLGMPARKLPAPWDAATARRILVDGLARDGEVSKLAGELAPLHPRNNTFPGHVLLDVAADVLDWCGASLPDPLALEGMRERFLPEFAFRGRQNKKLQYAILAAAALHGGTGPDLLDEVTCWQTDDFWQHALYAAVAYIRAAAGRVGRAGAPGMRGTGAARRPAARMSCAPWCLGSQVANLLQGQPAWPSLNEPEM
jgi:hypothetical protein